MDTTMIDGKIKKVVMKLERDGVERDHIAYRMLRRGVRLLVGPKGASEAATLVELTENDGVRVTRAMEGHAFRVLREDADVNVVLREAAETFHAYAQNHLAKDPPQVEKATRNIEMATKLYAALGEEYTPSENVLVDEMMGADAPREPQEGDSALPGMPAGVPVVINAVAAIRASLDAKPIDYDQYREIDQHLDTVMLVTDADVPAYIRTCALAAMKTDTHTARVLTTLAESIEKGLHTGLEDEEKALREITDRIGAANVAAGWWSDADVDLRTCDYTLHVVLGKLALVVTEVSEAVEGWRKSKKTILMDDHLPHRPMMEVEIADAHIRLFDLGANVRFPDGRLLDVPGAIIEKLAYNAQRPDHKPENRAAEGGKAA